MKISEISSPMNNSVRKSMQGNRSTNTKPELILRKAMWRRGLKGYRVNCKNVPGTPDICNRRLNLAVFVNGCFWHRCPSCALPLPKSNSEYWRTKFARNVERDKLVISKLTSDGWRVEVVWECRLRGKTADIEEVLDQLGKYWERC